MSLGGGQRQAGGPALRTAEEFLKTLAGGAGVGDLLPASDRKFDRLKRPAQQDRSGDHGAAGNLVPHDQPRSQSQDRDLDHLAQELGRVDQHGVSDRDGGLMAELALVVGLPAPDQAGHQVHRLDRFGIAESGFGGPHRPASRHSGGGQRLGRHIAVEQCQREQHHGGTDRHVAQDRMQQVDHRQIDRHPGGIEQEGDATAEEAPQAVQVAERVHPVVPPRQHAVQRTLQRRGRQPPFQPFAKLAKYPRADEIQRRHQRQSARRRQRQERECSQTARCQDPVEDLHHVERRGQHQDVDQQAESRDPEERLAAMSQRRGQRPVVRHDQSFPAVGICGRGVIRRCPGGRAAPPAGIVFASGRRQTMNMCRCPGWKSVMMSPSPL